MSVKRTVKNYFAQMLVECGHIVEMDGRICHM